MGFIGLWICGFLCGVLFGQACGSLVIIICVFALVIFLASTSFVRLNHTSGFMVSLGFLWGGWHNAPIKQLSLRNAKVFVRGVISSSTSGAIIRKGDIRLFANTDLEVASLGDVRFLKSYSNLLALGRVKFVPHEEKSTPKRGFELLAESLRFYLEQKIKEVSPKWQPILFSIILGQSQKMEQSDIKMFKNLGVFHLFVISGLHVSFFASLILLLYQIPFRFLYLCGVLTVKQWMYVGNVARVGAVLSLYVFALAIGFPHSAQRAFLVFFLSQVLTLLSVRWDAKDRVLMVLSGHMICFPVGFLCIPNLLSWLSYLVILVFSKRGTLVQMLCCQILLFLIVGAFLGCFSVSGIFVNLLLVPLFPVVLCSSVLMMFKSILPDFLVFFATTAIESFLLISETLFHRFSITTTLFWDTRDWIFIRFSTLLIVGVLLIYLCIKMRKTNVSSHL